METGRFSNVVIIISLTYVSYFYYVQYYLNHSDN